MSNSLLSSLTLLLDAPAVQSLASRVGESEESVSRAIKPTLAVILRGIIEKTKDAAGLREIFDMIKRVPTGAPTAGVNDLAAGSKTAPLADMGRQLLQMLFGGDQHAVADTIARTSGLPSGSAARLMTLAAPMVLGLLSKRVHEGELGFAGFESLLQRESSEIKSYLPAGLNNIWGAAASGLATLSSTAPSALEEVKGRPWWLVPAVAALALLLGVIWFAQKPRVPSRSTANLVREGATRARAVVPGLGEFVERRLPDSVSLTVPEKGVESQLLSFIQTSSQPVDNTWFDFDRLTFDTGSAVLRPESEEQLQNIASIMKAFPNLRLKIGGYTDNTGSSTANLRLSQNRADAVTRELAGMGIAPNHLEGEGYGDQHPIADNSTEEGRAKNRRISMRVLQK